VERLKASLSGNEMELCQLKEAQEEKSFVADMSPDQAQKQFLSFHLYLSEAERVIGF